MTPDVDPETMDLCRQLCTKAGMLFEDAGAKAVLIGHLQPDELRCRVQELRRMANQASVLVEAAGEVIAN